jgi:hypothetical protein
MKPIRLFALSTALLLPLASAQAAGIEGAYNVNGVDVQGSKYVGKLTVTASGPVFRLVYKDEKTQRGMGIQRGNNLFAAWGPSDKCMVSALEVKADGNMDGPWGDLVKAKLGTEKWQRQSGAPNNVLGTYAVDGVDQEGNAYPAVATITARGNLFQVSMKSGGETFLGIGVRHANYLAISYGGNKCGVTAYNIKPDNSMSGVYAEYGANKVGTEEITRGR